MQTESSTIERGANTERCDRMMEGFVEREREKKKKNARARARARERESERARELYSTTSIHYLYDSQSLEDAVCVMPYMGSTKNPILKKLSLALRFVIYGCACTHARAHPSTCVSITVARKHESTRVCASVNESMCVMILRTCASKAWRVYVSQGEILVASAADSPTRVAFASLAPILSLISLLCPYHSTYKSSTHTCT